MYSLLARPRSMILKIRHALLEISNHPTIKQSAIIINNDIVLTSGSILQPYVNPILPVTPGAGNDEHECASTKIIKALQQCRLVDATQNVETLPTPESLHLNSLSYQVTYDRRKLPPSDRRQAPILTRQRVKLMYLYNSPEISRQLHTFMHHEPCEFDCNTDDMAATQNTELMSSFLVLCLRDGEAQRAFKRFLTNIAHYIRYLQPLHTLDDVLVMATPFGIEQFFKSISLGKVSNVLGREGALFLISNPLSMGCEGAAVFNNKLHLIGMIICTSFRRQQNNVNLTMVADFAHLLCDFMRQLGMPINSTMLPREPTSNFTWERAMVVIQAGGKKSTGTFVKILQRKFILTCSHVLLQANGKVYCRSVDGEFDADVLWYNSHSNRPFDVALLSTPAKLPDRYCARLSVAKPSPGQMVFNAGFPCVINFNLKYDFSPSIFQGRIIKYGPGAIVSDGCVQNGQSGGPMFDRQGNVLGICISNIKMEQTIYPNVNTAVPICEIRHTLENYAKTNDITVLDKLIADTEEAWSPTVMALSKL